MLMPEQKRDLRKWGESQRKVGGKRGCEVIELLNEVEKLLAENQSLRDQVVEHCATILSQCDLLSKAQKLIAKAEKVEAARQAIEEAPDYAIIAVVGDGDSQPE